MVSTILIILTIIESIIYYIGIRIRIIKTMGKRRKKKIPRATITQLLY
jgi:hypothetical protein